MSSCRSHRILKNVRQWIENCNLRKILLMSKQANISKLPVYHSGLQSCLREISHIVNIYDIIIRE